MSGSNGHSKRSVFVRKPKKMDKSTTAKVAKAVAKLIFKGNQQN